MTDEEPGEAAVDDGGPGDPVAVAREIALRLLTVRARSRSELQAALARRKVPAAAADEVLDRFSDVGLIDDAAFARAWVESGTRRMRGRRALAQELGKKGVEPELIAEALAEREPDAELQVAREFAEKKARTTAGLDYQTRFRRLSGALARRGFSTDIVLRVVREVLREAPDEFTD